jgi:hypothetical protein
MQGHVWHDRVVWEYDDFPQLHHQDGLYDVLLSMEHSGGECMQDTRCLRERLSGLVVTLIVISIFVGVLIIGSFEPNSSLPTNAEAIEDNLKQMTSELLGAGESLPAAGAGMIRREGRLEWHEIPNSPVREIITSTVEQVELRSGSSLVTILVDDDPTCVASVDAAIVTSDGQEVLLTMEFWDYCRLTPWSLRVLGDGWKPRMVYVRSQSSPPQSPMRVADDTVVLGARALAILRHAYSPHR